MKNIRFVFVVALVLFGGGPTVQAHQKYSYSTKGNQASFSSWSYDDCSYSNISVWAFEEQQKGSNKTSYGAVYVDYYSYDFCSGHSEWGYAYFDGADFRQQKLNSASVDVVGSIETVRCDYGDDGGGGGPADAGTAGSGAAGTAAGIGGMGGMGGGYGDPCTYGSVPLELSLDWTGQGETFKDRSTSTYSSPYSRYRYRASGQSRDAAVSGVFSIGGVEINLASGWGSLAQTSSGSFEMYH